MLGRERWFVAALAAALAAVATMPAAHALPILDTVDAEELAADLAEATEAQGICYGWAVQVQDDGGSLTGADVGSNLGVGKRPSGSACPKWIMFTANIHYTSESSESEDSSSWDVVSNVGIERKLLERLGISGSRLLSGNDDLVILDATRALPALAAEAGLAPPIELEAAAAADVPDADGPTGSHGSDWTRQYGAPLAVGIVLVLFGAAWIVASLLRPTFLSEIKESITDDD